MLRNFVSFYEQAQRVVESSDTTYSKVGKGFTNCSPIVTILDPC
jgi:hypothetical protein